MDPDTKAAQLRLKKEWTKIRGSFKPLERQPPVSRYIVRHMRVIKRNSKKALRVLMLKCTIPEKQRDGH